MAEVLNLLCRADELLKTGQADEAASVMAEALQEPAVWPDRGSVLYVAGRVAYAQGKLREAAGYLQEASKLAQEAGETAPRVHYLAGVVYRAQGFDAMARDEYRLAVDHARMDGKRTVLMAALQNQVVVECRLGLIEAARTTHAEAQALIDAAEEDTSEDEQHQVLNTLRIALAGGTAKERFTAMASAEAVLESGLPVRMQADAAMLLLHLRLSLGDVTDLAVHLKRAESAVYAADRLNLYRDLVELKEVIRRKLAGC